MSGATSRFPQAIRPGSNWRSRRAAGSFLDHARPVVASQAAFSAHRGPSVSEPQVASGRDIPPKITERESRGSRSRWSPPPVGPRDEERTGPPRTAPHAS